MARRQKKPRRRGRVKRAIGRGLYKVSSATMKGIGYLKSPKGRKQTAKVMKALSKHGGKSGKRVIKYAKWAAKNVGAFEKAARATGKAGRYLVK